MSEECVNRTLERDIPTGTPAVTVKNTLDEWKVAYADRLEEVGEISAFLDEPWYQPIVLPFKTVGSVTFRFNDECQLESWTQCRGGLAP
ncbi:MAG: hypothetical protein KF745_07750 [Phycisphaeraceae bacterium]|nr:hypothetical protein [Phycisphaeraceae bacterium]